MKLRLVILCSLIVMIHGDLTAFNLYNPSAMFLEAEKYQADVTALQQDIVETITELRSQLSAILKRTSNTTLSQVQDNIWEIFEMDAPVRELIFVNFNQSTECVLNLRVQLNAKTEFSGFESSNCLSRYDRNVSALINAAYGTLVEYETQISIIQMIVVNAFNGFNIWLNPEQIIEKFRSDYNTHFNAWKIVKENINSFLATLENDIGKSNTVLGNCFTNVQNGLVPHFTYITNAVEVCEVFDN